MRELLNVSFEDEQLLIENIAAELIRDGFNANNTLIITVSTDYSSIIGQTLRHLLSADGEICDGFGVDVPYPDDNWDEKYLSELDSIIDIYGHKLQNKRVLMVEAGVIRGGNYTFLDGYLTERGLTDTYSVAMFENIGSVYKSDYVGKYYNNETHDLTFWWERENNHWK
tara:strand:- start:96 stop:602 length:507 start_codon:yes stop_codon:yes gene_type:complete